MIEEVALIRRNRMCPVHAGPRLRGDIIQPLCCAAAVHLFNRILHCVLSSDTELTNRKSFRGRPRPHRRVSQRAHTRHATGPSFCSNCCGRGLAGAHVMHDPTPDTPPLRCRLC